MIALISSGQQERAALGALCEARKWSWLVCESIRGFRRSLTGSRLRVVVTRHKLADGYSDDVFAVLKAFELVDVKVIVLAAAGISAAEEARQLSLGVDCVLRDPVRAEVMLQYVAKFVTSAARSSPVNGCSPLRSQPIAGGTFDLVEQRLRLGGRVVQLTPREASLARVLIAAGGDLISYDELYEEILGRRFCGDTSNLRVLLNKLCLSAASIGIPLRAWIEVVPKLGYRYVSPDDRPDSLRPAVDCEVFV